MWERVWHGVERTMVAFARRSRTLVAGLLLAAAVTTLVAALPASAGINYTVRLSVRGAHLGPYEQFVRVPVNTAVQVRAVLTPKPPGASYVIEILGASGAVKRCVSKPTCLYIAVQTTPTTLKYRAVAENPNARSSPVLAGSLVATVTWTEATDTKPYFVYVLTNVASPGNIFVGQESALKGKFTCDFPDGGLCADAGGADVPVMYQAHLGPYPSCATATAQYNAYAMNPHPAFGGQKVYIFGNSYFIDDVSLWCGG